MNKRHNHIDSGPDWLVNHPPSWKIKPLKHIANVVLGKMLCNYNKGGYQLKPYLKSKNVQWLHVDISSVDQMWFSKEEMDQYFLKKGDLILSEGGEVGKTCIWNNELSECYIQNSVHKVSFSKNNFPRYYLYLFFHIGNSGGFEAIVNRVSIAHLTKDKLSNLQVVQPSLSEQTAIANFLDNKTAKIDTAIAQKEKMIALLQERRQIIIQGAVTKGLDPEVAMKDSGVDWIGEIPAHWETKRVKNLFRLIVDPAPPNNKMELLSIYTDIGVRPRKDLEQKGNRASTTDGYWKVKKGDFIVNKLLAWMGAIGLSEYEGVTSPAYDILRPIMPLEGNFYHFLFRTSLCSSELKKHSRGIMEMRLRLYFDKFGTIEVPYPSKKEQQEIVAHINAQSAKIDQAIALQQQQIEKLKEYKAILINDAVTGKIKIV